MNRELKMNHKVIVMKASDEDDDDNIHFTNLTGNHSDTIGFYKDPYIINMAGVQGMYNSFLCFWKQLHGIPSHNSEANDFVRCVSQSVSLLRR